MMPVKSLNIAFVYNTGRLWRTELIRRGDAPREFFLGSDIFRRHGHKITEFEVDVYTDKTIFPAKIVNTLSLYGLWPIRAYGGLISNLWRFSNALKSFDVIVATTSGIAFSLEILRTLHRFHAPIVGIHCGLLNFDQTWARKTMSLFLLKKMWTVLYGEGEEHGMKALYKISDARLEVNQFGVDTDFWRPSSGAEDDYILSIGNDGQRDYNLLMRIAKQIGEDFIVVTKRKIKEEIPKNVKIIKGNWHTGVLSDIEIKNLYQRARCVVIPLIETPQPSGQSVCLQAMACGKPVILSKTQGLWSQNTFVHGDNIIFVAPGNEGQLIEAITELINDKQKRLRIGRNACQNVRETARIEFFGERLLDLCERVVRSKAS